MRRLSFLALLSLWLSRPALAQSAAPDAGPSDITTVDEICFKRISTDAGTLVQGTIFACATWAGTQADGGTLTGQALPKTCASATTTATTATFLAATGQQMLTSLLNAWHALMGF